MLGQPATALDIEPSAGDGAVGLDNLSSDDLGLDKVLKTLYRGEETGAVGKFTLDQRDFSLKERLDDRECYLMDGAPLHRLLAPLRLI